MDGFGNIDKIDLYSVVITNNGVEHQNESFNYSCLQPYRNSLLTGMLAILAKDFLAQ